jgi:hypothetical protein
MRQPDVDAAGWWFAQTHELVSTGFAAHWRLAWLPHPGSVSEQDAWLWEALQIIRAERMQMLSEARGDDELKGWRRRKRREVE